MKHKMETEIEVKYLQVDAGPRFWEDSYVNGEQDDENGTHIPCRIGSRWKPKIDLDTGQIVNWKEGVTAKTHYKVCDDGLYILLGKDNELLATYRCYVPKMLSPDENGWGDYMIMTIDENGFIKNFKADLSDLTDY